MKPLHPNLNEKLLKNLSSLGFSSMTLVQEQSLPPILEGRNVIVQAKTGSGKTIAFGLALLNRINLEDLFVQGLVLCPTRELAEQITQVFRKLALCMPNIRILNISGGLPMNAQVASLNQGAHIIIGTPGRVKKHLESGSLNLNHLLCFTLDEADRMLDMGFYHDISDIFTFSPLHCQTLFFSATYAPSVKRLAEKFILDPLLIISSEANEQEDIEQVFYKIEHEAEKFKLLRSLLFEHRPKSVLVFCNLKETTISLSQKLRAAGFRALALHGDMEQVERDQALIQFRNHSCTLLIATDIAARGLDIEALPLVINYDLAANVHAHVHRVGRTGRTQNEGLAISFILVEELERVKLIEKSMKKRLSWGNLELLDYSDRLAFTPDMVTMYISAGRKDKVRPGDILGVLAKDAGLLGETIGKIEIGSIYSYVAIHKDSVNKAIAYFADHRLKGRKVQVKKLS